MLAMLLPCVPLADALFDRRGGLLQYQRKMSHMNTIAVTCVQSHTRARRCLVFVGVET
jgi:hypothetical protein